MADIIRVLIVDDSPLMRAAIKSIFEDDPAIEVVGLAKDGKEGVEKAAKLKPDVITMDLKMPIMSGLEAIEEIMQNNPVPIIVVSSLETAVIVKALGIGAMDFVSVTQDINQIAQDLLEKVKIASRVRPLRRMKLSRVSSVKQPAPSLKREASRVLAIGISTGGPQALQLLFAKLPANLPLGILVVQHMSKGFIEGLAEWIRATSALKIKVAKAGDTIKAGEVLLAPDDFHMKVNSSGMIVLSEEKCDGCHHIPSVDAMMCSVADAFGEAAIGLIMTGMGIDGVEGIKAIKKSGGRTIAQDESSSVIFGMNKAAIESGAVDVVLPLEKIAEEIIRLAQGK